MRFKVTDKATGETRYLSEEELASLPARRVPHAIRNWPPVPTDLNRDTAIKLIRDALKKRSGKQWSVTGGRGTGWGWLSIDAPPARRKYDFEGNPGGSYMSPAEREELSRLLDKKVHHQGESVPASTNHYREYIDRARGLPPSVHGQQYWD